jgi:hypothetical protein
MQCVVLCCLECPRLLISFLLLSSSSSSPLQPDITPKPTSTPHKQRSHHSPVPHDSALVWWPAFSLTAYGWRRFLATPVCTVCTISGRIGALKTCGNMKSATASFACCFFSQLPISFPSLFLQHSTITQSKTYLWQRVRSPAGGAIRREDRDCRAGCHRDLTVVDGIWSSVVVVVCFLLQKSSRIR